MKPADLGPGAIPEPLLRSWEEEGKKPISLMYRRDVPQFRTPFLAGALNLWTNWRLFDKSPPCGIGWANERNVTVRILQLLESENNKFDVWEREEEELKRKKI